MSLTKLQNDPLLILYRIHSTQHGPSPELPFSFMESQCFLRALSTIFVLKKEILLTRVYHIALTYMEYELSKACCCEEAKSQ
jgi:hypothetical protein